ncbi:hypothetical protein LAZ67_20000957 [Cordylochernes scorpioides]|uniref:Endonuclease/exonuclease/phosphatase domain-containing protein n=1 Tax=Cordylochernes scorpioides TaxID=51811 RepID=A0ABY6LLW0_9ARAC|nr:hypothetical protein LAZ67_20000957 [Cordylochernes scorpioides]
MELNQYDGGGGGSQQANKRPRSEDEDLLPSSHHQFKFNSTANLFNFECQTFEAIIADTSLDSPEKIQMATKGLILTLVQEAELLLKDAFKGASLGRPNPTANVPIPSTSFASVVAEKDKPVKPAPTKPKAKSTFVNLAPSFESHVVVRVDGEVRDDEICESFRSNHSVQSLLEKREIRVVHRSNNAAHSTSTVFIEVDNQVAEILGQHGRIPVAGLVHRPLRVLQVNAKKSPTVILEIANLANSTQADIVLLQELSTNFFWPTHTAITSIAICLEQSIIVVHSAYWHGLRAADDFIPLLQDTIRRTSLPVILGMDTNAHSPTWGIGARLDFRGANLEEFASYNDFHFLGPPVDSTWSNGPLSSSIDVTLASSSLAIHVTRDMVNNETKSSWVESSCKEQTFKSFLNSSLHQRLADRHGWFFEDQYKSVLGTLNGRSAEDALASITQLIEERQAHWRKTLVISSDIKSITCLVKSFLEDRTVSYSAWTATECTSSQLGTPQGSALSPFLWNIVARTIFTLPSIIDSRLIAYAHDSTLMTQYNVTFVLFFTGRLPIHHRKKGRIDEAHLLLAAHNPTTVYRSNACPVVTRSFVYASSALGDEFFGENGTQILPQPPYSQNIAPNDFFLFPKFKVVLKGRQFDTRMILNIHEFFFLSLVHVVEAMLIMWTLGFVIWFMEIASWKPDSGVWASSSGSWKSPHGNLIWRLGFVIWFMEIASWKPDSGDVASSSAPWKSPHGPDSSSGASSSGPWTSSYKGLIVATRLRPLA